MKTLEEKIIEILDKDKNLECKYDFTQEKEEDCLMNLCSNTAKAKEIASMMKEFILWKDENTEPVLNSNYPEYYHCFWIQYPNNEAIPFDEVFDYWEENIR